MQRVAACQSLSGTEALMRGRPHSFVAAATLLLVAGILTFSGCGEPPADTPNDDPAAPSTGEASPNAAPSEESGARSNGAPSGAAPAVPSSPRVRVETSLGNFTLELDPSKAPLTVRNFLHYVENGFYDDTVIHQVDPEHAVLGGSYDKQMQQKTPDRISVRNEARDGLANERGTIGMARLPGVIDSATTQFYINLQDHPDMDYHGDEASEYGYCVFGRVVKGMEVVDRIGRVEVEDRDGMTAVPTETIVIERMVRSS